MGLFFISQMVPTVRSALVTALTAPPIEAGAARAQAQQTIETAAAGQQFIWSRFVGACVFLLVIVGFGIYAGHDDKMKDWSAAALHTFQILLGGLVGLVLGEKPSS
jgi:hypothetical protein